MSTTINRLRLCILAAVLSVCGFTAGAQKVNPLPYINPIWVKPYEPFRIVGNLYYVGTYDLASYLITTPQGHILINTGLASSVPMIRQHVEALGFKFEDIKILLCTHAHYDHVGGMAAIKKITGAEMMVNEAEADVLADGGNSDYLMGGKGSLFYPLQADRLLHDGDTVSLGGMHIVALHHPGHTKGATSFLFDVRDEHRLYRVLIANMPTILDEVWPGTPAYPNVQQDFAYTLKAMRKLKFDIFLASHGSQFGLDVKRKEGDAYNPVLFSGRTLYDNELDEIQKKYAQKFSKK